jgi:1-acyl-sn-glycerol-3-phosphate acyltransferase
MRDRPMSTTAGSAQLDHSVGQEYLTDVVNDVLSRSLRMGRSALGLLAGAASFVFLIFVLNPIQMLSVLLVPFSKSTFRAVNRWCARSIWGLWVLMAEVMNRIELRFSGDVIPHRENAVLLANHQTMADIMVLLCFSWRCRRLGDVKWFVKDVVKYVPGPGWGMRFLDCIFVKRDWAVDKRGVEHFFAKYKAQQIPLFLITFPEGTRMRQGKLEAARVFAESRGLVVPKHTLVPRTKGFAATIAGLRGHLDAVYDLTIAYPSGVPTLAHCYAGTLARVDVHFRRYAIETLPKDEEALASWMLQRFSEKDQLLEEFEREGRFPGRHRPDRVRVRDWFLSGERDAPERSPFRS